ncbi:MAG TPA: glycine zipper domain-containing protein [Chitinophaga sp.]
MKKLLIALAATAVFASCHNNADNAAAIESAKQATIDSMNMVNAQKDRIEPETKAASHKKRSTAAAPAASSETSTASSGTAAPAKKKGWSHTAKGAVVGAGAGAITGAVVNKNDRVKGAAIGTIVGAGMGAGIGAIVDHEKKKKEAAKQ